MQLFFGVPKKHGHWEKLPSCRNVPRQYEEDRDGKSETKKIVFSYSSFIHVNKVNELILEKDGR